MNSFFPLSRRIPSDYSWYTWKDADEWLILGLPKILDFPADDFDFPSSHSQSPFHGPSFTFNRVPTTTVDSLRNCRFPVFASVRFCQFREFRADRWFPQCKHAPRQWTEIIRRFPTGLLKSLWELGFHLWSREDCLEVEAVTSLHPYRFVGIITINIIILLL